MSTRRVQAPATRDLAQRSGMGLKPRHGHTGWEELHDVSKHSDAVQL